MGGLGEFERPTLSQRTREALLAARKHGARLGRPPRPDDGKLRLIREKLDGGETITAPAWTFGVAPWTMTRALRRADERRS